MEKRQNNIPYENCLNCGAELMGKFCHKCGQQATSKTPKIKDFILEYLNNAFIWDTQFVKTIAKLVCRPGYLTNEYMSGKFISQEHPLKLNMFLLFVFVSMFLLFSGPKGNDNSANIFEQNEIYYPALQVEFLKKNQEFAAKLDASPRDTVQLHAPLNLAAQHPDIISKISVEEDTQDKGLDRWVAVVPRTLIEEEIIIPQADGYYKFNTEERVVTSELSLCRSIWSKLVDLATTYFPIMMLFTMPLLALAVALIQRKNRLPFIHHFIFSLHYTAFLELMIMVMYALYLIASPSMAILQWILRVCAGVYLTIAFRKVYEPNSWFRSVCKALFTYLIYSLNCLFVFVVIFIIACLVVISVQI